MPLQLVALLMFAFFTVFLIVLHHITSGGIARPGFEQTLTGKALPAYKFYILDGKPVALRNNALWTTTWGKVVGSPYIAIYTDVKDRLKPFPDYKVSGEDMCVVEHTNALVDDYVIYYITMKNKDTYEIKKDRLTRYNDFNVKFDVMNDYKDVLTQQETNATILKYNVLKDALDALTDEGIGVNEMDIDKVKRDVIKRKAKVKITSREYKRVEK